MHCPGAGSYPGAGILNMTKHAHEKEPETETKHAPKAHDRMVRVRNVHTRDIIEQGKTYKPGDELDLTPDRMEEYKHKVKRVHK
jgi:hypothetical protein